MTSIAARILDALDPTAAAKAAAITGQQSPTATQLAEDSAEVAELFGSGDAEGTPTPPVWEAERPVILDAIETLTRSVRSILVGSPAPSTVTVYRVNPAAAVAGISVQLVPPSAGIPRRVRIQCLTGACYISPDRRDTGSATAGDTTGFAIDSATAPGRSQGIELVTTGALFASSDGAYDVRVLIEHFTET